MTETPWTRRVELTRRSEGTRGLAFAQEAQRLVTPPTGPLAGVLATVHPMLDDVQGVTVLQGEVTRFEAPCVTVVCTRCVGSLRSVQGEPLVGVDDAELSFVLVEATVQAPTALHGALGRLWAALFPAG